MNVYDLILSDFPVYTNQCRWDLSRPYKIGEYVMATNGHIAIRIPVVLLDLEYNPNPRGVGMAIFEMPRLEKPIPLNVHFTELDVAKWEDRFVKCDSCDGKGYYPPKKAGISCDDCTNGKQESIIPIAFDGRKFSMEYLILLQKIARQLERNSFNRISDTAKNQPIIYQFGATEIALMSLKE